MALEAVLPWLADAFVVLGVFVITIGVYGMIRMPDVYTRLHAASKSVFLGVISLLAASTMTGDPEIILRVLLIAVILIITTPVSAHVVGKAAYIRRERMRAPEAIDESGSDLPRGSEPE